MSLRTLASLAALRLAHLALGLRLGLSLARRCHPSGLVVLPSRTSPLAALQVNSAWSLSRPMVRRLLPAKTSTTSRHNMLRHRLPTRPHKVLQGQQLTPRALPRARISWPRPNFPRLPTCQLARVWKKTLAVFSPL